jgi:peptidoglycan/xylan/chitin deacetylase (PgdA/CDA1 family)
MGGAMSRLTVIAYHAVGDCPRADDPHNLWVSTDEFERQLGYLRRRRHVVSLADAVTGRVPGGRPAVAVTFDDGYRSVLTEAAPRLARLGFPATVFVPTRYLGDRNRWDPPTGCALEIMTADELREVERLGVAVESHGHAHVDLSTATVDDARADLEPSVEALTEVTGRRPRHLAYPYRTGSDGARRAARDLGFEAAFTIDLPHEGRFAWGRVQVVPGDSDRLFALKTSGLWLRLRHNPVPAAGYRVLKRLRR